MDEDEEEVKEKPVPKYVVSGGLTGFGVANDLMFIDFSPPEEAPEEFRATPYNAKKITTLKSGVSGTGIVDQLVSRTSSLEWSATCTLPTERTRIMHMHAGTFGKVDPGGDILIEYLKQLEEQQAMVKEMIANQRLLLTSGKLSTAGRNPGRLKPATGKMVGMRLKLGPADGRV